MHILFRFLCACVIATACVVPASSYSVLTHEEIIDLLWDSDFRPLLLQKFPHATADELKEAHAYAYGGAVIQDLGYYPFGSAVFSNLVHYVRSGDFVENLIRASSDINDYAFALGALSHYASDTTGHPAVNRAVAIEYPKLRAKYGNRVTYAQGKTEHLKTEFGFDVVQVATNRYAPQSYHDFVGFKVSTPLLERAFFATYGVPFGDVIAHEDLAIGTYRHAISKTIPHMTKVALATRHGQIVREHPDFNKRKFLYNLSRADYEKSWGKEYEKPGSGAKILAFLLRLVPKIGPLKGVQYKDPTPATEDLYFKSVNATVDYCRDLLRQLKTGSLKLENRDFDTGMETRPGEYPLTDDLLRRSISPERSQARSVAVVESASHRATNAHNSSHRSIKARNRQTSAGQSSSQSDRHRVTRVTLGQETAVVSSGVSTSIQRRRGGFCDRCGPAVDLLWHRCVRCGMRSPRPPVRAYAGASAMGALPGAARET
jgi:hypothetical protein